MSKNKGNSPLVYSTNPDFGLGNKSEEAFTLSPGEQKLRLQLESKHRGGKMVTIITGFVGNNNDLNDLAKQLKAFCGTGGSAKDGEIIIQGDNRDKLLQWFQKKGYSNVKKSGG